MGAGIDHRSDARKAYRCERNQDTTPATLISIVKGIFNRLLTGLGITGLSGTAGFHKAQATVTIAAAQTSGTADTTTVPQGVVERFVILPGAALTAGAVITVVDSSSPMTVKPTLLSYTVPATPIQERVAPAKRIAVFGALTVSVTGATAADAVTVVAYVNPYPAEGVIPRYGTTSVAQSGTTTAAIDLGDAVLTTIEWPATMTSTTATLQSSIDGTVFQALVDATGSAVPPITVSQGKNTSLADYLPHLYGQRWLKIVCGSSEAALRTIRYGYRPMA